MLCGLQSLTIRPFTESLPISGTAAGGQGEGFPSQHSPGGMSWKNQPIHFQTGTVELVKKDAPGIGWALRTIFGFNIRQLNRNKEVDYNGNASEYLVWADTL